MESKDPYRSNNEIYLNYSNYGVTNNNNNNNSQNIIDDNSRRFYGRDFNRVTRNSQIPSPAQYRSESKHTSTHSFNFENNESCLTVAALNDLSFNDLSC